MASRKWAPRGETFGMTLVLLAVMSIPAALVIANWLEMRQARAAWAIEGPPCPRLASDAILRTSRRPPHVFDYGGVRFARQYGHASCVGFREDGLFNPAIYRVCQFNAPATLAVTTGGQQLAFKPGVGHHATVTIRGGRASCVVGGWFAS